MIESGKRIYLCRPNQEALTLLNGVVTYEVNCKENLKDYSVLEFSVDRFIQVEEENKIVNVQSNGYDDLKTQMKVYLEDIGYFILEEPTVENDSYKETKLITACSHEKELEGKDFNGLKINCGTSDSQEYLIEGNINDLGFAKEYITFYNEANPKLSLLNIVLNFAHGWTIGYVDELIKYKKFTFEVTNSTNVYEFLTNTVASKASCVFLFDKKQKQINVYGTDTLGTDTNVFIGFRNLQNSVTIEANQESFATRYFVLGDNDLDIRAVNYGDRQIINLDYLLTEPYMTEELAEKVRNWLEYRETHRQDYVDLSKQAADLTAKISEIQLRVPNDGDNWKQWDEMTEELLQKNLTYYNTLLTSLQMSVDTQYQDSGGKLEDYIPWTIVINGKTEINHDKYLNLLFDMSNGYGGYYTYIEIRDYIIPNIKIALENIYLTEENEKDYIIAYETNWDLYGIKELEGKRDLYQKELMKVLDSYSAPWSTLNNEERANHSYNETDYNKYHERYLEYKNYLGDENTPNTLLYKLKQLNDEVLDLESQKEVVASKMSQMRDNASMEHASHGFDESDYVTINNLFYDMDYQNNNIITTSLDTTVTTIDVQETLYQDAIEKLSEVAQPQYTFTSEMDNLLNLEEFKSWYGDFVIGNYIRLGIRDDYSVKLRIISRSWNPCEISPDLSVEFSNMITSRSGRNDFTHVFDSENNSGSKNSTSIGGNSSSKDGLELSTDLLKMITNSGIFNSAVTNIVGTADLDSARITSLVGEYLRYSKIDVGKIEGDEARFKELFTVYFESEYAVIEDLIATNAIIEILNTDMATIKTLLNGNLTSQNIQTLHITSSNTTFANAVIGNAAIASVSADKITAGKIYTNLVNVQSENGQLYIADNTIQIKDTKRVRVQIGEDSSGDYSMYVWDTSGNLMFDALGLHESGIKSGIIKNDMVSESANISANKLNIPSLNTVINDGRVIINSGNISMDADGQRLSAAFNTMTKSVDELNDDIHNLSTDFDVVQGQITAKIWESDITTAVSPLNSNITTLSDKYTVLNQTVDGLSSTVANQTSIIEEKADGATVSSLETQVTSLEQNLDGFKTSVSENYATQYELNSLIMTTRSDLYSAFTQTMSGFKMEVSSTYVTQTEFDGTITTVTETSNSQYEQLSNKFSWLIKSGSSSSNFTLTDRTAQLVAENINLQGLVTFSGFNSDTQNLINTTINNSNSALSTANSVNSTIGSWCYENDISWMDGGKLYTGSVVTDKLAANSITTDKLQVGLGTNLIVDGFDTFEQYTDVPYYSKGSYLTPTLSTDYYYCGTKSIKCVTTYSTSNVLYLGDYTNKLGYTKISPNKTYILSCYVYTASTTSISVSIAAARHTAINTSTSNNTSTFTVNSSDGWKRIYVRFTTTSTYPYITPYISVTGIYTVYFDAFQLEEVDNTNQLPGAFHTSGTTIINGNNLITGTVDADKITANAITTDKILAGAITANKISVTSISSLTSNIGTMTAGILQSSNYAYSSGNFSSAGMIIDLNNRYIRTQNLFLSSAGSAYFTGNIDAESITAINTVKLSCLYNNVRQIHAALSIPDWNEGDEFQGRLRLYGPRGVWAAGSLIVGGDLSVTGTISALNLPKFMQVDIPTSSIAAQSMITILTAIPTGNSIIGVNIYCSGSSHSLIYAGFSGSTNIYIRNVGTGAYTPPSNSWVRISYI